MTNRDIYLRALSIIGESCDAEENEDYEERAPYLLAAFCTEAKEIDFHLMLASEPKHIQVGKISLPMGMTLTYDKSLEAEIETFDPVGMDTNHAWGTDKLYRIHFKTTPQIQHLAIASTPPSMGFMGYKNQST